MNSQDLKRALGFSNQDTIDWQLVVKTTFFDHSVPNQPGFSYIVAVVTILPGVPEPRTGQSVEEVVLRGGNSKEI